MFISACCVILVSCNRTLILSWDTLASAILCHERCVGVGACVRAHMKGSVSVCVVYRLSGLKHWCTILCVGEL